MENSVFKLLTKVEEHSGGIVLKGSRIRKSIFENCVAKELIECSGGKIKLTTSGKEALLKEIERKKSHSSEKNGIYERKALDWYKNKLQNSSNIPITIDQRVYYLYNDSRFYKNDELLKKFPSKSGAYPNLKDCQYSIVDGYCFESDVCIEVFATTGEVLEGQLRKLAKDVLKLISINAKEKVIITSSEAKKMLEGTGWIAVPIRINKIQIEEYYGFEELNTTKESQGKEFIKH